MSRCRASQHLIAGFDYVHDHGVSIDTSGFGAPYDISRDNGGVFGGWRVQDGAFDSEISGRYDHYDAFGSAFSGSGADRLEIRRRSARERECRHGISCAEFE